MGEQQDELQGGFVDTHRTEPEAVTTVIVTPDGASAYRCPGGLTEDEMQD